MKENLKLLLENVKKGFFGAERVVNLAVSALLARGHLLIEDLPGVGKTTLALSIAQSIGAEMKRVQFTSDLLPSDITGVFIYNMQSGNFDFKQGPLFTNILLADEINRTSPKTQSALLEAMQEKAVTIENKYFILPEPFMVIATQNPIELYGTYPLPEAQLDRFLINLSIGYPESETEKRIIKEKRDPYKNVSLKPVIGASEIIEIQKEVEGVFVHDDIVDYIMKIVTLTRENSEIAIGISSRGALALFKTAQAMAYLLNRNFVTVEDIKNLVEPVFLHRVLLKEKSDSSYSQRKIKEALLNDILQKVEVPL